MIAETPNILIVHLQRIGFNFETFETDKVNTLCKFPTLLDLKPYSYHEVMRREGRMNEEPKKAEDNTEASGNAEDEDKKEDEADKSDLARLLGNIYLDTLQEKPVFYEQLQDLWKKQMSEMHLAEEHVQESVQRLNITHEQVRKFAEAIVEANAYTKSLEDRMKQLEVQRQKNQREYEANNLALEEKKEIWEETNRTVRMLTIGREEGNLGAKKETQAGSAEPEERRTESQMSSYYYSYSYSDEEPEE